MANIHFSKKQVFAPEPVCELDFGHFYLDFGLPLWVEGSLWGRCALMNKIISTFFDAIFGVVFPIASGG